jgi:hypothetical protein
MGCWSFSGAGRAGRWHNGRNRREDHQNEKYYETSSGNSAFDDYREETLKRLEDEQIEFQSFLERLRHAKDKAEFDQFMNDRGNDRGDAPQSPPTPDGNEDRPSA